MGAALAAVPDLIAAFVAANHALSYVLLLLFVPLALLRALITAEGLALAWESPAPRAACGCWSWRTR